MQPNYTVSSVMNRYRTSIQVPCAAMTEMHFMHYSVRYDSTLVATQ